MSEDDAYQYLENIANGSDPNAEMMHRFASQFAEGASSCVAQLQAVGFTKAQATTMVASLFGWRP